ncbi:MAG: type I-C CRISPR-associated protein Cas8c/Csd1 [Thermoguttaceae bacterium]|nr:type I-C CRISPR-associated protein Cas8c/Csd1 [Thermoguttaceae bacterium]
MIIHSLAEYYRRKVNAGDSAVAPFGWEYKEIPYIIALDANGYPVDVYSTVTGTGKDKKARAYLVPQGVKRSSGIAANLLWDNPEYAVGVTLKKDGDKKHADFARRLDEIGDLDDAGWRAVRKFVALPLDEKLSRLEQFPAWQDALVDAKSNTTFKLDGDDAEIVSDSPVVRAAVDAASVPPDAQTGRCLITNDEVPIENLHPAIKGVWGGNPTGTGIVSFNLPPFCSFGKKQGANAPIGKPTVFAYTTALNTMLDKESKNRMQVGEASTVFWAAKPCALEENFAVLFAEPPKAKGAKSTDDADAETPAVEEPTPAKGARKKKAAPKKDKPDANIERVKAAFDAIQNGAKTDDASQNRFFVLGLSPNAARLAIRFWRVGTVAEISQNIEQYFNDLAIQHSEREPEYLSLFRVLVSVATQGKSDAIPPTLEGDLMRAILDAQLFSRALLQAAIVRIRAEQRVTRARAAIIKAYVNRFARWGTEEKQQEKRNDPYKRWEEIAVSLDKDKQNAGYQLGRLFATLEKIQDEALPGINATIRDRFYGAASGTPAVVFPNLMRLKNHHLSKLDADKRRKFFEKLLGEIVSKLDCFPKFLSLESQGQFAVGYYHQMQDFYTKRAQTDADADAKTTDETEPNA